jgi:hypothetical protein
MFVLSPISCMELLHVCAIFLLLILFIQYPTVDAKPAEVDLQTNLNTHSRKYIVIINMPYFD